METDRGWIKFRRGKQAEELIKDPKAWTLYSLIAYRAKRTNEKSIHGLEIGEALIGDYRACGLTEKEYRGAKERLSRIGIASFRRATTGANKGTIAKLIDSSVFDINAEQEGEQKGEQRADKGRTEGGLRATKKKLRSKEVKEFKEVTDARPAPQNAGGLSVKESVKEPMPDFVKDHLRLKDIPKQIDEVASREKLLRQAEQLKGLNPG